MIELSDCCILSGLHVYSLYSITNNKPFVARYASGILGMGQMRRLYTFEIDEMVVHVCRARMNFTGAKSARPHQLEMK